uniref:Methionine aminopeptidase n=1 Tax=Glossina brevipalpis TaxID=37001 RepID=A0A1A9W0P3_9MUSC
MKNLFLNLSLNRIIQRFSKSKKNFGHFNKVELGNVSPERSVPLEIQKPDYYYRFMPPGDSSGEPEIKTNEQIKQMRLSCKLTANILKACEDIIKVGVTTDEIDAFLHELIISSNAYPSPLRYAGFPKSICTSVNDVACHGIPDDRNLVDGDIVNVDISVYYNGYHGDCSKTFLVGNVDEQGCYLVKSTEECVNECINLCRPNLEFNSIGNFINKFCERKGLNVIPAFIGHGIGTYFHGPPEILHFKNNSPGTMQSGMTFTIEPILTFGGPEVEIQTDGWTATTVDGSRTAQFEHTILITETGAEVLTTPD